MQKAADAKTGGRVRSTRHAISNQRNSLGPAFTTQTSPKLPVTAASPTRGKRSTAAELPSYAQKKRTRNNLIQPVQKAAASKAHKRTVSNEKRFASLTDGFDLPTSTPRIKLKYRIPEPLITHPLHIPPPKQFNSLNEYLDSFILLDDHEDTTFEKAEAKARQEAAIRDRIANARAKGWLADDSVNPAASRKQPEPQNPPSRHDIMLKHVLNFSSLMAQERRSNISRAKRIAQMITQHFKKLEGTDEKEIKAEEKRIRRLAKQIAQEVRKKWKLAERVCSITVISNGRLSSNVERLLLLNNNDYSGSNI